MLSVESSDFGRRLGLGLVLCDSHGSRGHSGTGGVADFAWMGCLRRGATVEGRRGSHPRRMFDQLARGKRIRVGLSAGSVCPLCVLGVESLKPLHPPRTAPHNAGALFGN